MVLLTTDAPVHVEDGDALTRLTMQRVVISLELMDPREGRYTLTRPEDFVQDVNLLRRRYQELNDAPPVCDAIRFPDRQLVNELLAFNMQYKQFLEERLRIERVYRDDIEEALRENRWLYEVLDCARDTKTDYYYLTIRRTALKKLRELIGSHAYYAGCLPPPVPVWRFRRID